MKQFSGRIISLLISIFICIPSVFAVFYYTQPMEDISYDLSLIAEDGQEWEGEKGWTVYTEENGKRTELTSEGYGSYSGLAWPGQTFYFSRSLSEELDSPMLQIGAANRTFSVFLDNEVIYTDCPELDNRIGHITLPMLEYDRAEPVTISLPPDYHGKTLTIAQSTPESSELASGELYAFPADVMLYCGYSYESGLISSAVKTMIPAVLLFALEIFLLAAFLWKASMGIFCFPLPVFALAVLFQICSVLAQADFFFQYFGSPTVDPVWMCFHLSVGALLLFLALYSGQMLPLFLILALLQWGSAVLFFITQAGWFLEYGDLYQFFVELPQLTGFFAMIVALVGSFILCKHGSRFFRCLSWAALVLIIGYALFAAVSIPIEPGYVSRVLTTLRGEITLRLPNLSLKLLWNLCLLSTLAATVWELIEQETQRRTEYAVLSARNELAVQSYENLRLQSDEVMMLRHDTMKHYSLLRTMAKETPERVPGYLDELIGQAENIRPVVSSQNQTLNILLNGKLHAASVKGIATEIVRSDAPEKLPLTDAELCRLIVNILDNAINAASSETAGAYIKLDFHCKEHHFVFSCENSISPEAAQNEKNPTPQRGYGLKIIRQVMSRFGDNMLSIEKTPAAFRITTVIPLSP